MPRVRINIVSGKDYVIGRKGCDIVIDGDKSISRKHGTLRMTHHEENLSNPNKHPLLTIEDESKFGIIVNDSRIAKNNEQPLNSGNVLNLGTMNMSIYRVEYRNFILATSCLDQGAKKSTKSIIARLGGHLSAVWSTHCELLVMSELNVTIKVVCALVSQKYIVTSQYLVELLKCHQNLSTNLPDPKTFTPVLTETQLCPESVDFNPMPARSTLFTSKVVIFLTKKQYNKLFLAIELAGGMPMLLEDVSADNDELLTSESSIVMATPVNEQTALVKHATKVVEKSGCRLVPDSEVVFAVLYCSLEKYCNPKVDVLDTTASSSAPSTRRSDVFAQNTELNTSVSTVLETTGINVVPETLMNETTLSGNKTPLKLESVTPQTSKKRQRDSDEFAEPAAKQIRSTKRTTQARIESDNGDNAAANNIESNTGQSLLSSLTIKQEPVTPNKTASPQGKQDVSNTDMRSDDSATVDVKPMLSAINNRAISPDLINSDDDDLFDGVDDAVVDTPRARTSPRARTPPRVRTPPRTRTSPHSNNHAMSDSSEEEDNIFNFRPKKPRTAKPTKPQSTKSQQPSQSQSADVKVEPVADMDAELDRDEQPETNLATVKAETAQVDGERQSTANNEGAPPVTDDGFMTSYKAKESDVQVTQKTTEVLDNDVPRNLVQIKVATLVSATYKPKSTTAPKVKNNAAMWKGKMVKNFKKFRKVAHAGSDNLPTIIGGNDLIVHVNDPHHTMDDMIHQEREDELLRASQAVKADKLFDFHSRRKKR